MVHVDANALNYRYVICILWTNRQLLMAFKWFLMIWNGQTIYFVAEITQMKLINPLEMSWCLWLDEKFFDFDLDPNLYICSSTWEKAWINFYKKVKTENLVTLNFLPINIRFVGLAKRQQKTKIIFKQKIRWTCRIACNGYWYTYCRSDHQKIKRNCNRQVTTSSKKLIAKKKKKEKFWLQTKKLLFRRKQKKQRKYVVTDDRKTFSIGLWWDKVSLRKSNEKNQI